MPEYDALCDKHCRITKTRTFSRHLRKQRAVEAKVAGSNAERAVRKASRALQRELSSEARQHRKSRPAALIAEISAASEREARVAAATRPIKSLGRRKGGRRSSTGAAKREGKAQPLSSPSSSSPSSQRTGETTTRVAPKSATSAAPAAQGGVATGGLPPLIRRHSAASLALPLSPLPRARTATSLGRGHGASKARPMSRAASQAVSRTKAQTQTQAQAQGLVPSRVPSRYMASATYPFACVSGRQSDSVLVVRRSVGETAEADDVLHTRPEPTRGPFLGPLAALNEIGVDTRPLSRAASRLAQSTTVLDIRRELTLERSQKRQLERAAAAEEEQAREERARRHAEAKSRREDAQRQQLPRSWSGSLPSPTAVHARRRDDAESLRRALAQQQAEEERRAEAAARVAESYAEQRAMRQAVLEARRSATAWRGRATRPTTSLLQRSAACQRPAATVGGGPLPESPSRRIFPQLRRVDSRRALAKSMGVSVQLVEAATQGIGGGSQGSQLPSPSVGDDGATASTSGAAAPARVSPPGEGEGVAPPLAPEPAEEATSAERGEEGDSSSVALAD